jgi:threonine synthase
MGLPIGRLLLATNENNVLDEFFRSGRYRVRSAGETHLTSSPSMDISKASNFERYVFDIVGRDPDAVRELWWELDARGEFDLRLTPFWSKVQNSGVASRHSTHAERIATIRNVHAAGGVVIDPHTADGVKVARELREPGEVVVCLETALPAKFEATIVEALGHAPPRPAPYVGIEDRPQRVDALPADAERVKAYLAEKIGP